MKKQVRYLFCAATLALAVTAGLSGCGETQSAFPAAGGSSPAPAAAAGTQAEASSPGSAGSGENAGASSLTLGSDGSLAEADNYPDLQELDVTGSSIPLDDVLAWAEAHPDVTVKYTVPLGSGRVSSDAVSLTAEEGLSYEALTGALRYLPNITTLNLPETALNASQLAELEQRYTVNATVSFMGTVLGPETESLDLSALTPEQVPEAAAKLSGLANLQNVELMDADGQCALGVEDVKTLVSAVPQARFHYSFDLFGKRVSTTDERVEFVRQQIGNDAAPELRAALDILYPGTYVLLDDCGFSDEVMASIRDDYPDKKVVWRVHCGTLYNALTDDEVILMTFEIDDTNCSPLQYCTEVRYIDVGHNSTLHDISWMANMTKLECVIVSGAPVSDISCFANCPNLEWLELCFCLYVKDLTPIQNLTNLRFLNVSFSTVEDLTPLDNVPLERFNNMGTYANWEMQQHFLELHPDCITLFEGVQPYGYGWRYDDEGVTQFSYYAKMRRVFHYPDEGWYGGWKMTDVDLTGLE